MVNTYGSTPMRQAWSLPAAVERELARLERRHGQRADLQAQRQLAELGEAAAVRVLRRVGESRQPVDNLSASIGWMTTPGVLALDGPASQYPVCGWGPSQRGDYVLGPARHHAGMSYYDISDHDMIEAESLTWSMPYGFMLPWSPERGLMHQVGIESPVRHSIYPHPRTSSTPSPVRNITQRLHQLGGPSRTGGFETSRALGRMMPAEPFVDANASLATGSPQMVALGELEFVKVFLIYVYLAGKKIEDVRELREEYIRSLHSLPMDHFESEIWHRFGHKFIAESERRKNLDWDPSKTRVYHCHIEKRDDSIVTIFKGPYVENSRTHLQKVVGDDNVLVVKFSDMPRHTIVGDYYGAYCSFYRQVAENGIILGLRRYRFLIYKDEGKDKRKEGNTKFTSSVRCYFVRTESGWDMDGPYILSNKTMDESRKLFMHIHTAPTVRKYLARFALILSKTTTLLDADDLSNISVTIIDDVPCKDTNGNSVLNHHGDALIHTDGTGTISEDLAKKCPKSDFMGNLLRTDDMQPLLMQIRMFYDGLAIKGTLLVDRRLPCRTIHIRPSMIKVASDPNLLGGRTFNSVEIVSTSHSKRASTSRFLIALLHYGGVPADYFLELVEKAQKDAEKACHTISDSLKVAFDHADMDDSMSAQMLLSGIQPKDDAYLQSQLAVMTRKEREGIKLGRIPIDETYYLMGTTDPTGTLKPNEVCVILDNGQISGEVLVYKHPGLHFGDIHVLAATPIPGLENIVGSSKHAIFFPISGPRSLANEISNGDLDGDMYWVSRNPQLLKHFRPSEPRVQRYPPKRTAQNMPQDFEGFELENFLFREFCRARFAPSYAMGTAADSWMAYMDRLLTDEVQEDETQWEWIKAKVLDLVDIHYDALDSPNTGNEINVADNLRVKQYPHYMERKAYPCYHSTSVLGKIYDEAMSRQAEDTPPRNVSLLTCFAEEAVTKECKEVWASRYREYVRESSVLCKVECKEERCRRFLELYRKYKLMLYGAAEFDESPRNRDEVFNEACVIYQVVYGSALRSNSIRQCGFAWKVAGHALCQLHAVKRGGRSLLCSNSVLRSAA